MQMFNCCIEGVVVMKSMKLMRGRLITWVAVLFALLVMPAAALDVELVLPVITFGSGSIFEQAGLDLGDFQEEFTGGLEDVLAELDQFAGYANQQRLVRGFANAGATAAHAGTLRSFTDFRRFALAYSLGAGVAIPGSDPAAIQSALELLEEDPDIYLGAAFQPVVISAGLHLAPLVDRLYITGKVGFADIADGTITEGLTFSSFSAGAMANYQLLRTRSLPLGFLRWRGVSVGSGLLFQRNETKYSVEIEVDGQAISYEDVLEDETLESLEAQDASFNRSANLISVDLIPTFNAGISSRSYTVPLEVSTGLRVLWLLDINVGAGIDLSWGTSEIVLNAEGDIEIEVASGSELDARNGEITIDAGTRGSGPEFIRPRITGGVGLNLGPVKVDFPLMYYPDSDGAAFLAGVNVGIVW